MRPGPSPVGRAIYQPDRLAFRSAAIHSAPACEDAPSRGSPRPAASISQASHHRSAVSSDIPEPVRVFRIAARRAWKMR